MDKITPEQAIEYMKNEAKTWKQIMDNDPEPEDAYAYFNIYTEIAALIQFQQEKIIELTEERIRLHNDIGRHNEVAERAHELNARYSKLEDAISQIMRIAASAIQKRSDPPC